MPPERPPSVVWVRTLTTASQSTYHLSQTCQWLYRQDTNRGRVKQTSQLNATLSGRQLCAYCAGWHRGLGKRA